MTAFETWFSADFQRLLTTIEPEDGVFSSSLGIQHASWDRRAGFLLWAALGRPNAGWVDRMAPRNSKTPAPEPLIDLDDLLGDVTPAALLLDDLLA